MIEVIEVAIARQGDEELPPKWLRQRNSPAAA
jgi:hypothetical protein